MVGPIPAGLADLVEATEAVASTLSPLLAAAADLVSIAQAFFNPTSNPYAALVNSLITQAEDFNNDLFATGVYELTVDGDTIGGRVKYDSFGIPLLTPGQAITAAISSLSDICDTARPQFSNEAEVTAIGFLATAPSPGEFLALINGLLAIFNLPTWANYQVRFNRRMSPPSCQPTPPVWESVRLNSISDLQAAQTAVNNLLSACQGYEVTADSILTQLAQVISGKQAQLTALEQQMNVLIQNLRAATGLYVLNLPPTIGGNQALATAFYDCPLSQSTNQYTIATIFVGGGVSLEPINLFRQMVL